MSEPNEAAAPQEQSAERPEGSPRPARPRRFRRLLRRLTVALVVLAAVGAVTIVGTEYYTSQPSFCGSCHIMQPYHASWQHDPHASADAVARCVDCHYRPGEQHTIKAKFKGLSQLMSYFSGRAGKSRPRAQVADASCTTAGCHGDMAFMERPLPVGQLRVGATTQASQPSGVGPKAQTVTFTHAKHMRDVEQRLTENRQMLADLENALRETVDAQTVGMLRQEAQRMCPLPERVSAVRQRRDARGLAIDDATVTRLVQLTDLGARLDQLGSLSCASCHAYDESGTNHFQVSTATCYTCHFANQAFDQGTGTCLGCHAPPTSKIVVHGSGAGDASAVVMDHKEVLARKVSCQSCHADLVAGTATVRIQDCQDCHDQERYLEKMDRLTTEVVGFYHHAHTKPQHARCTDCHREIRHVMQRVSPAQVADVLYRPAAAQCEHCHPSHHAEQIQLLAGTGGRGLESPIPNPMIGVRLNCRACHIRQGTDAKGITVQQATKDSCKECHPDTYESLFERSVAALEQLTAEANDFRRRAEAAMKTYPTPDDATFARARTAWDAANTNLRLVETGHGIHNPNLAKELLDISVRNFRQVADMLAPGAGRN